MTIQHRPGRRHGNADGLSRKPCRQCGMSSATDQEHANQDDIRSLQNAVDIKAIQASAQDIKKLRLWLDSGEKPEAKEAGCESPFLKALIGQWERLEVRNDIVVRRWENEDTKLTSWQAIIPPSRRREILVHSHDIRASGHLGVKKTLNRISQKFYWPGVRNDVKNYIAGCVACNKRKNPIRTKRAPMEIVRCGFPMERIAVDILGELPHTRSGNKYILVIGDYFTKWTECHPMPNQEAMTVAKVLFEQVISRFGVPSSIHSDQGRQFESQLFQEMCKLLQIEKTRTTPYHARSDGMVERFNKTLVAMLSSYVNENHTDWDEHLQYVMMAYRSAEHETTGVTPNLCMLGRETTTPLDLMYAMPTSCKEIPEHEWVWELQERIENAHQTVREKTGEAMRRQKKFHDRNLSFNTFEVGEKCYVFFPVRKVGCSSKLTSYWRGPYEVREKLSDVLYRVNCGRSENVQVIHCDRMRKCLRQFLVGEDETDYTPEKPPDSYPEMPEYEEDFGNGKRERRKPAWMTDYVLSLFRDTEMPKTKTSERKAPLICAACKEALSPEDFKYHIEICIMKNIGCDRCKTTFATRKYYLQHLKRKHPELDNNSTVGSETTDPLSDKEDDIGPEPDIELTEDCFERESTPFEELLIGRTVSKRTAPEPVLAPKRKRIETVVRPEQCESETQTEEEEVVSGASQNNGGKEVNSEKEYIIRCNVKESNGLIKQTMIVENSSVGEIFSSSTASRTNRTSEFLLKDIMPDGSIDISSGVVKLSAKGQVSFHFQYN